MDTNTLLQNLRSLMADTKSTGEELARVQAAVQSDLQNAMSCKAQAQAYREQANALMSQSCFSEDSSESGGMQSKANAYYAQASQLESRAEQLEAQAEQGQHKEAALISTLRSHAGSYQSFISECRINISSLGQAFSKMESVSTARFGATAASKALQAMKERIGQNQAIAQKSTQVIQYISSLIGEPVSAGSGSLDSTHFDAQTGRFSKCFGEMQYDRSAVMRSVHITGGMWNPNPAKASKSFSDQIRYQIQINAISQQLTNNPTYFRQFGCNETSPTGIRSWFSDKTRNPNYVLHETNVGTVQIVDRRTHELMDHTAGVSSEKADLISGDGIRSKSL